MRLVDHRRGAHRRRYLLAPGEQSQGEQPIECLVLSTIDKNYQGFLGEIGAGNNDACIQVHFAKAAAQAPVSDYELGRVRCALRYAASRRRMDWRYVVGCGSMVGIGE